MGKYQRYKSYGKYRWRLRASNGKIIAQGERPVNIIRPGAKLGDSDVHAITGATQTSDRVEKIINKALNEWREQIAGKAGIDG